jgi:CRISPR-associated protein Csd1
MLELLARYADPTVEPGFKPKDVRWSIVFDSNKGFLGMVELGTPGQKRNPGRTFPMCPDLRQAELIGGSTARSHFLIDTAEVVAMYDASDADSKIKEKHQNFIGKLAEVGKTTPQLDRVAEFLKNDEIIRKIQSIMRESKVKASDKVTFQIDGEFPLEKDNWHTWWRSYRKSLKVEPAKTDNETSMRCFVTGELASPLKTHPKIERLAGVGGQPSGDVLIGFDKEAYRSYGLEQSANAAVSEEAASAYSAGLNELIKNDSQRLAGTKVVHWFKEKIAVADDPLEWLVESSEQQKLNAQHAAQKLLESIRTGERADLAKNYYYALTLSGAAGRVMVRDWLEGQFVELVGNIGQWFNDLEVVRRDGNLPTTDPKFMAVLGSLVRELKDLPGPLVTKMWRVAIRNEGIPFSVLAQTLARRKIEILSEEQTINLAGIGLIKAYHLRKYRKEGNTIMSDNLKPVLNEDFPSPAYQCGRLMAVLAELQRAALGDVGAGVIQRYYASASTTPALVLGRLTRTSQFHLNKLEPGLTYWYESKISGIWSRLNEAPPRTLSLEDQSLFAMGYYQQLAFMRVKISENTKEKKEATNG